MAHGQRRLCTSRYNGTSPGAGTGDARLFYLRFPKSADDIGRISEAQGGRSLKIHLIYLQIIKQITAN
jgi:hypothetical protein